MGPHRQQVPLLLHRAERAPEGKGDSESPPGLLYGQVCTCHPSTLGGEAGGSQVQTQSGQLRKTLSQETENG